MRIKNLINRRLVIFLFGILVGCASVVGLGAAATQQTENVPDDIYFHDKPEISLLCFGNISNMSITAVRGGKIAGIGVTIMLGPDGRPLVCTGEE
jgi:hypothetical protein